MTKLAAIALVLAACGPREVPRQPSPGSGSSSGSIAAAAPADAPAATAEVTQEARLAAIQLAMNHLDEASQQCWAKAATKRFDIEGDVVAQIEIAARGPAAVTLVRDTTRNVDLTTCLRTLLASWPWAPPLHGEIIQLPFRFRAPAGQHVIDRELVDWKEQGGVSVAVLLDEASTGNGAASMLSVAMSSGATTGLRRAERAELWYFLAARPEEAERLEVTITAPSGNQLARAGDMLYVPRGGVRELAVRPPAGLRAVVVLVPGGIEGTARSGALPTPLAAGPFKPAPPAPLLIRGAAVKRSGPAAIFVEPATVKGTVLAASTLHLAAGVTVAEHVHAKESELLYVISGGGTMTIAGVAQAVTPTSVIQIPPNTKHAFTAERDTVALQIYTPAGPEQRFKAKAKL